MSLNSMAKQSVEEASFVLGDQQWRGASVLAPPTENLFGGIQFPARDFTEHREHIEIGEPGLMIVGRRRAVEHHRDQTLAVGLLQPLHQLVQHFFHSVSSTSRWRVRLRNRRRRNRRSRHLRIVTAKASAAVGAHVERTMARPPINPGSRPPPVLPPSPRTPPMRINQASRNAAPISTGQGNQSKAPGRRRRGRLAENSGFRGRAPADPKRLSPMVSAAAIAASPKSRSRSAGRISRRTLLSDKMIQGRAPRPDGRGDRTRPSARGRPRPGLFGLRSDPRPGFLAPRAGFLAPRAGFLAPRAGFFGPRPRRDRGFGPLRRPAPPQVEGTMTSAIWTPVERSTASQ